MPLVSQAELVADAIAGKVVSFPTDTVPALAVLPEKSDLIFAIKQRSADKPLILMAATADEIWNYVRATEAERSIWQAMMQRHWPGQLTLVLPASSFVPAVMNPLNSGTIGIRIPNSDLALGILKKTGPLATTSANLSGQPPLEKMYAITTAFPEIIVLNCDNLEKNMQKFGSGQPSTVIQWTGSEWKILRQGSIVV